MSGALTRMLGFTATAPSTDPSFSSVKLLLGFNGTDGATTSSDESPAARGAATFLADAQLDTAQKKFGASSLLLDGTADHVTYADHADWTIGTNTSWTWELWIRFNSVAASQCILSQWETVGSQRGFAMQWLSGSGGLLQFAISNSGASANMDKQVAWAPSTGTWYHVAACRSGNNFRLFVDGVQLGTTEGVGSIAGFNSNQPLRLGGIGDVGIIVNLFNGWMDEVRYTPGVARYTANFTPPTAAFPRS